MAEAVKRTHLGLLKMISRLSASLLGALGVITASCGEEPVAYGLPPALHIAGDVRSDGEGIEGLQLRMLSAGSSEVLDSFLSDQYGNYWLDVDLSELSLPDSVIVEATDIDGENNGAYLPSDTLVQVVFQQSSAPDIYLVVNFELEPDEE